jgi:hypothetical protein
MARLEGQTLPETPFLCYPSRKTDILSMPKRRQQSGLFSFTIQWLVMLLLLVVALAPVGVLTYYAMTIAADSMARQIDAENFAAVSNFRGQVGAEFRERFALVQAASEIPRMVRAVATQDRLPATEDMKNLTTVDAGIERAFILTPEGAPWARQLQTRITSTPMPTSRGSKTPSAGRSFPAFPSACRAAQTGRGRL